MKLRHFQNKNILPQCPSFVSLKTLNTLDSQENRILQTALVPYKINLYCFLLLRKEAVWQHPQNIYPRLCLNSAPHTEFRRINFNHYLRIRAN